MINIAFEYKRQDLYILDSKYANGRLALVIHPTSTGGGPAYCVLTVNLPNDKLEHGEFFVKTWSENEGIANHLRVSGIFTDTGKRATTGFTHAEVWKFNNGEIEEEENNMEPEPLRRR